MNKRKRFLGLYTSINDRAPDTDDQFICLFVLFSRGDVRSGTQHGLFQFVGVVQSQVLERTLVRPPPFPDLHPQNVVVPS